MVVFYSPRPIDRVSTQAASPPTTLVTPPEDPRYAIARDFVRPELVSPDAAQFPSNANAYHLTNLGEDRSQISSYATVKMFGGGMTRAWWTVTLRYIGGGRYVLDGKGVELFKDGPSGSRQE
jgi:hypothetical protein